MNMFPVTPSAGLHEDVRSFSNVLSAALSGCLAHSRNFDLLSFSLVFDAIAKVRKRESFKLIKLIQGFIKRII